MTFEGTDLKEESKEQTMIDTTEESKSRPAALLTAPKI
jgi:hypothetical protein